MTTPPPLWLQRLPNRLTVLRIIAIPIIVVLLQQGAARIPGEVFVPSWTDQVAAILFAAAAATDFFDGWIARRYNVQTLLGKLLDPLADKLLVVAALIILVGLHRLPSWIAVVLIVRDLGINAIRLAAHEDGHSIPSSLLGKSKTTLLDIGITGVIVGGTLWSFPFYTLGHLFVWAALIASVVSAIQYLTEYARADRRAAADIAEQPDYAPGAYAKNGESHPHD